LMAASGNFITDILRIKKDNLKGIRYSQLATLVIGVLAIILATKMQNVLDLMLYSYAFMVSGLFVPVLGFMFLKKPSATAAMYAMLFGGGTTLVLILSEIALPYGLDANVFGVSTSAVIFIGIQSLKKR
jgi:SSS family solute:Na+ symporter